MCMYVSKWREEYMLVSGIALVQGLVRHVGVESGMAELGFLAAAQIAKRHPKCSMTRKACLRTNPEVCLLNHHV
jgi:hypothetical protein